MCKALEDMCQHAEEKGSKLKLKELVEKKVKKGCSVAEIADMLEEDTEVIAALVKEIGQSGLGGSSLDHRRREEFPAISAIEGGD